MLLIIKSIKLKPDNQSYIKFTKVKKTTKH